MKTILRLGLLTLFSATLGCTHPIGIEGNGEGDIVSSTGTRNCSFEDKSCSFVITGDYIESYTAVPRNGSVFSHWKGCFDEIDPVCSWEFDAALVSNFYFKTMPASRAIFVDRLSQNFYSVYPEVVSKLWKPTNILG